VRVPEARNLPHAGECGRGACLALALAF